MRLLVSSLLALVLLVACGGNTATPSPTACDCPVPDPVLVPHEHPHEHEMPASSFVAGTRLSPMFRAADDDTKVLAENRFFDSELGVECSFTPTPGGAQACLPWFAPVLDYHLDAACTKRIAIAAKCDLLPHFGQQKIGDACGSLNIGRVFSLDVEAAVSNIPVYLKTGATGCVVQPNAVGATNVAMPILEELSPDAFVKATTTTLPP